MHEKLWKWNKKHSWHWLRSLSININYIIILIVILWCQRKKFLTNIIQLWGLEICGGRCEVWKGKHKMNLIDQSLILEGIYRYSKCVWRNSFITRSEEQKYKINFNKLRLFYIYFVEV